MNAGKESNKPAFDERRFVLRDRREVVLRAGGPGDAKALLSYMHRCLPDFAPYVAMDADEFKMTEADERGWLESQQDNAGSLCLLAFTDDEVVAVLNCSCRTDRRRFSHIGHIGMSSDKAYWGSGLGGVMMPALIDWAERHPVLELLELDVFADNARALSLYRRTGFTEIGVFPGRGRFADGTRKDNVLMYRRVDGSVAG